MRLIGLAAALLLALAPPALAQVGFQTVTAPDPADQPLPVSVWYPTEARGMPQAIGPYSHEVAPDAPLTPRRRFPLVVISHGSGGSSSNNFDMAAALARAGFVVAAVTHTGDNSRDPRYVGQPRQFIDRTRHVARVIDYMTGAWTGSSQVDARRVGVMGFSAGATTALVSAGGVLDMSRFEEHCRAHPDAGDCRFVAEARKRAAAAGQGAQATPAPAAPASQRLKWTHDRRVKAAVLIAPALGSTFTEESLRRLRVPVQLWAGDKDETTPPAYDAEPVRRSLPSSAAYRLITNAGHHSFLPVCPAELQKRGGQICSDPPGFNRAGFRPGFNASVVEFFTRVLQPR